MSLRAIAGGLLALTALAKALAGTDANHDDVLRDAYDVVDRETDETTNIYVDHIDVDADGNPREATPGTNHVPDLVVSRFADHGPAGLVAEVETDGTLDGDALDQLEDYATPGYQRVLVVPDDVTDNGVQFLEESDAADSRIAVAGPSDLSNLL
jgi:hypothetical protein